MSEQCEHSRTIITVYDEFAVVCCAACDRVLEAKRHDTPTWKMNPVTGKMELTSIPNEEVSNEPSDRKKDTCAHRECKNEYGRKRRLSSGLLE